MIGVIANFFTVILGSTIGMFFGKIIPERVSDAVMKALGFCVMYIGISGALEGKNIIVIIISMALGTVLGSIINIDDKINRLGDYVNNKFKKSTKKATLSEGFVSGSLLFCVGAMTIVGSLNAGISGDNTMLFTKSALDFVSSMLLSVSLGFGVFLSSFFVLVFQGLLVILSSLVAPYLNDIAISNMTCAGSLMILSISFNMIGITKIKTANFTPALIFVPIATYIGSLF